MLSLRASQSVSQSRTRSELDVGREGGGEGGGDGEGGGVGGGEGGGQGEAGLVECYVSLKYRLKSLRVASATRLFLHVPAVCFVFFTRSSRLDRAQTLSLSLSHPGLTELAEMSGVKKPRTVSKKRDDRDSGGCHRIGDY